MKNYFSQYFLALRLSQPLYAALVYQHVKDQEVPLPAIYSGQVFSFTPEGSSVAEIPSVPFN